MKTMLLVVIQNERRDAELRALRSERKELGARLAALQSWFAGHPVSGKEIFGL